MPDPLAKIAKKERITGSCRFEGTSPRVGSIQPDTRVIAISLTFEEALKLNLAVDECVRKLNALNKNAKGAKDVGLGLIVYLDKGRINVMPDGVRPRPDIEDVDE